MTIRVAIYARVSTVNHGQDVSLQTHELQQFAAGTPKLARRMNLTLATEHTHG